LSAVQGLVYASGLLYYSKYAIFVLVVLLQLAGWRQDKIDMGYIDIRWAQTYNYGYVPNPVLENVFMANAMDLPDYTSPYDSSVYCIHLVQYYVLCIIVLDHIRALFRK